VSRCIAKFKENPNRLSRRDRNAGDSRVGRQSEEASLGQRRRGPVEVRLVKPLGRREVVLMSRQTERQQDIDIEQVRPLPSLGSSSR
jgi:hypothetical protein